MAKYLKNEGSFKPFPYQKRSDAKKTKSFFKECVDAGVSTINSEVGNGIRANKKNMLVNYDLISNKIHDAEVQRVVNPFGIEYGKLPDNYRNCPLLNSNLMLLWGEERKRFFNPIVTMVNSDAINDKLRDMDTKIEEFLVQEAVKPTMSEEEIVGRLRELEDWKNFSYRDRRERMAQQIVDYGFNTLGFKEIFSRVFEDLTIAGDEILINDILAGEPIMRRGDPVSITTIRSGQSPYIDDSDIIIEDTYHPIGKVIDWYHDELTDKEVKKLEDGANTHTSKSGGLMANQLLHGKSDMDSYIEAVGIGDIIVGVNTDGLHTFGGAYDEEGNVRVTRVVWKGMRKIGIVTYVDELGELQKTFVDESYEADEELGETVKWEWISEWLEGTLIADDIYVKMGPRPVQFRSMDNLSKCSSGIVGTSANVGNVESRSLVDLAKDYQYLYNAVLQKMELAIAKDFGALGRLDLSMVPDEWSMDKWLYYAYTMGWMVEDPFNEGQKGASQGKLAGTMNQNSKTIDLSQGKYIGEQMQILQFLENRVDNITGISPQRKGSVENRETVGGIERSVTQSSHITEKWYGLHDNVKVRAIEGFIETAKVAWRGQSFKRNFILDDSSLGILDFDSDVFNEAEYGIYVATSSSDMEMIQQLKALTQPFLQNGGSMSIIMDIFRTKDPSSLQRKIERYEKQIQEQAQQAQQAENEAMEAQAQRAEELDRYKIDMDYKKAIDVQAMKMEEQTGEESKEDAGLDEDKLELDKKKHDDSIKMDKEKLAETKRSNKAKESIARSKPKAAASK
jgi:hypothetical protein